MGGQVTTEKQRNKHRRKVNEREENRKKDFVNYLRGFGKPFIENYLKIRGHIK